jgi:hypothetical protein
LGGGGASFPNIRKGKQTGDRTGFHPDGLVHLFVASKSTFAACLRMPLWNCGTCETGPT